LVDTDGLEMTYGSGSYFVAAPASVGMSRGGTTKVRFRDPKSRQEVALTLSPRIVRSNIELGPRTARWPGDQVSLRVELFDGARRPLSETRSLKAEVSVNLKPVEVKWQHQGNVMTANLKPSSDPGPWVVRVEVTHENGEHLGRDFLEIADSPAKKVRPKSDKTR
jgi:hypothetical protein